ncbi:MAG: hypothetical protein AB8G14_14830 [Ilumatobacter sp.]
MYRGLTRAALYVLSASDPNNVGASLLIATLRHDELDDRMATVIGLIIWRMSRDGSGRLLDVAPALGDTPLEIRQLGARRAEQAMPSGGRSTAPTSCRALLSRPGELVRQIEDFCNQ